jgi:DNA replication and repair protein RecF
LGQFTAVIFLPQMMRILEGGPEERRRYLNLALAQAVPGYAQALSEYTQVLTQRNALLKQLAERSGDPDQLQYWDDLLSIRGAAIIHARTWAIEEMELQAVRIHDQLTHSQEILRIVYQPAYDPLQTPTGQYTLPLQVAIQRTGFSQEEIRKGFNERLLALRNQEIARGVTTIGPHRDEFRVTGNGVDLGDFGSRGQNRTALLSLKLAEMNWLKQKTGQWPVLLLDEILAELDIQRRADLLVYLEQCEQAMLTTTDLNLFDPHFVRKNVVWQIAAGRVQVPVQE